MKTATKITLKQVKAGHKLPPPVYHNKPYIVLSKENVVLAADDLDNLKELDSYFDEFPVEVRQHDLHMNDNTKLELSESDQRIARAVARLSGHRRGQQVLSDFRRMMDGGAIGLDMSGWCALIELTAAASAGRRDFIGQIPLVPIGVIITVQGGVAEVTNNPQCVTVSIIDHDNNETEGGQS